MRSQSQNHGRKERRKNKYLYYLGCGIKTLVSGNTRPDLLERAKPKDK